MKKVILGLLVLVASNASAFSLFSPNVDAIKDRLKDPYSAKFEKVEKYGDDLVCGQVNSKNAMGAYTGKEGFLILRGDGRLASEDARMYIDYCTGVPMCASGGKTAEECIADVDKRIAVEKQQRQDNADDPKVEMLQRKALAACDNRFKDRSFPNARKHLDICNTASKSCAVAYKEQGYMEVYKCLNKINSISDRAPFFLP